MKTLYSLAFSLLLFFAANAQSISRDVIASAGDYFTSPVGSLSWTLGETVIETVENGSINVILTQGFQQSDERDFPIGIRQIPVSDVFVSLYPNPTIQSIHMDVKYDNTSRIQIELVDMLGRVLNSDNLDVLKGQVSNYQLDVSSLASGMYLFRLTSNGNLLNSYKFQKAGM
ncbi:MAG: T9SS type A sorting domain-containing protein [Chitinophagales bacterium]|nr:T9SS type A sorting domain-containing protein [Chitinophagales bacterium]